MKTKFINIIAKVLIVCILTTLSTEGSAAALDDYRRNLRKYWKRVFDHEAVRPVYYGSTMHAPKSVWVENENGWKRNFIDMYSDGIDLFPEFAVKTIKYDITLPKLNDSRETQLDLAFQLALEDLFDLADFKILFKNDVAFNFDAVQAEVHKILKFPARKCLRLYTNEVLDEYFNFKQDDENLFVVTKSVYLKGGKLKLVQNRELNISTDTKLIEFFSKIDSKWSNKKGGTVELEIEPRYYAVGLRALDKDDGLKNDAKSEVHLNEDLDIPTSRPSK